MAPSGGLQQTGVRLVAENESGFLGAMDRAQSAVKSFTGGIGGMNLGSLTLANTLGNLVSSAITGVIGQVEELASKMVDVGEKAIMGAARVQELGLVTQLLGQRAGMSSAEIDKQTEAIKALGIRTDVALQLQAQFARYNLNMAQATDLARVAQDAAVLSMEDSSTALDNLLYGILTYNNRVLRTHGINIQMEDAFDSYAKTLGKSADALSNDERAQAALNAVLAEGTKIAGVYAIAMEAPGKQLRSLTGREIPELLNALGTPFLDAFGNMVGMLRDVTKGFREAISEGGKLYPILQMLGVIADLVTEKMRSVAKTVLDSALAIGGNLAQAVGGSTTQIRSGMDLMANAISAPIESTASKALSWGMNIVQQLAIGIINGAKAALTAAMNFISSMLSSFLSPGSPPRVAPNIDKWGMAAMTQYLKGFTQADFSVLNAIQNPLKDVFSMMVSIGEMTEKKAGVIYANISKEIAKAITNGGKVSEKLFADIAKAGGRWGKELADLARKQIEYGVAVDAVKKAEETLKAARDKQAKAQAAVANGIREYNAMLRKGASAEELKKKEESINKSVEEAKKQKAIGDQAEKDLETAKQKVDYLAEQVKLQEELLKQLLEISRMQLIPVDEKEKGKGKGDGGKDKPPVPPGFGKGISGAIDKLKAELEKKLAHLFDPIIDAWNSMIAELTPKLNELWTLLGTTWENIKARLLRIWDNIKTFWDQNGASIEATARRVVQTLTTQFGILTGQVLRWLLDKLEQLSKWVVDNGPWIAKLFDEIGSVIEWLAVRVTQSWPTIQGILDLIINYALNVGSTFLALATGDWARAWEMMKKTAVDLATDIAVLSIEYLENTLDLFGVHVDLTLQGISAKGTEWGTQFKAWWTQHWEDVGAKINTKMGEIAAKMGIDLDSMKARWSLIWDDTKLILSTVWQNMKDSVTQKSEEIKGDIASKLESIKTNWNTGWDGVKSFYSDIWDQILTITGLKTDSTKTTITTAIDGIRTWITGQAENWKQAAMDMLQGFIDGVAVRTGQILENITTAAEDMIAAAKKALGIKSPSSIFNNIGQDLMQGLINGALSKAVELVSAIKKLISDAIAAAIAALKGGSPSRVFIDIGQDTMKGYQIGVEDQTKDTVRTMTNSINAVIQPAQTSIPASASYSRTANLNLGGVQVNNGMDEAILFAKFRQFLAGEL